MNVSTNLKAKQLQLFKCFWRSMLATEPLFLLRRNRNNYCYGRVDTLDIAFLDENLACFGTQSLNLCFLDDLTFLQLLDLPIQVTGIGHRTVPVKDWCGSSFVGKKKFVSGCQRILWQLWCRRKNILSSSYRISIQRTKIRAKWIYMRLCECAILTNYRSRWCQNVSLGVSLL